MLIVAMGVLVLICVEPIVDRSVDLTIGCSTWQRIITSILDSFINREEVDNFVFYNLSLLTLPQVGCKEANRIFSRQWELDGTTSTTTLSLLHVRL